MRHGRKGRKLGRTASHRRATMNNMATSLFEHGSIRTTRPKAKELRQVAERLITFAKRGDLHARRMVLRRIRNKVVVSKLFDEIGPSFVDRQGGYTRVLNLGPRRGDATEVCLIELVGEERRADFADTAAGLVPEEEAEERDAGSLDASAEGVGETTAELDDDAGDEADADQSDDEADASETDAPEEDQDEEDEKKA